MGFCRNVILMALNAFEARLCYFYTDYFMGFIEFSKNK